MRDLVLLGFFALLGPLGLFAPYVGLLVWAWVAFMSPHRQVYGIATSIPFNMIVAIVTIVGILLNAEKLKFRRDFSMFVIIAFTFWFFITSLFALETSNVWVFFDRHIKTMLLALLVFLIIDRKTRVHAFVLIIVASLAYYGIKGGGFVLVKGGVDRVWGPPGTEIADNNHLALALVMSIPLINYLRLQSRVIAVKWATVIAMLLVTIAILGSYSRGGLIGLAVVVLMLFVKSGYKILTVTVAAVVVWVGMNFMPASWEARMNTLRDPLSDASFQARLEAWEVNLRVVLDRPLIGAGFQAVQSRAVYYTYKPDAEKPRAAHSIYFQVMGEHGVVGLLLFLGIGWGAYLNARRVKFLSRGRAQFAWANDLATMIQASIVAFLVGGVSLSMAYYDVYFCLVALLASMRRSIETSQQASGVQNGELAPTSPLAPATQTFGFRK